MTYGGTGTLIVKVAKESGTGAVSFQWYKVEDGKETAVGSATTKNQFDLAAKSYPQASIPSAFSATCNGYKKMSGDIAVTVQKANIGASLITPPTAQENPDLYRTRAGADYRGQRDQRWHHAVQPDRERYIQPGHPYRHRCRSIYRVVSGDWRCKPQRYRTRQRGGPHWDEAAENHRVTAASKPYDGTTDAGIPSVTFDGVTLNRDTDYTVTASFDDAGVGSGKNVTATVTLTGQAAKNYALEQSSFPTIASITKAAAPDFTRKLGSSL